jgi:transposase
MKKTTHHLIAEVPPRQPRAEMTIGIDLGDVWSHYCTLDQEGEVVDRGRFRTKPKGLEKWFIDLPPARLAMEAGTHSIWIECANPILTLVSTRPSENWQHRLSY